MGKTTGPAIIKMRIRNWAGDSGKVEWLGTGSETKSAAFQITGSGWQEVSVEIPEKGLIGTIRLYLPAGTSPLEVDWIELDGKTPQRWDFGGAQK